MQNEHFIPGKDASLEHSITTLQARLAALNIQVEECSWLNPVPGVWSVHLRNRDCPLMYTNGKGASRPAALASALGEFFERLSCNYFWNHYYLGEGIANQEFAHYPRERWLPVTGTAWPAELLTPKLQAFYNPEGNIPAEALVDLNTGHYGRGICAIPYERLGDGAQVLFPVNIISNLYVSNGMAAGNSQNEARAQALSEILERHVKFKVIAEGLCLPDVPEAVLARHPGIAAGIDSLRQAGFGILVKDASLGGRYPVMCVTLLNPRDQGVFASFGAHPRFEVALERALTELLQGRALEALDGFPPPGLELDEVASGPNLEIHFVDSSGIVHWNFFTDRPDFEFTEWNFNDLEQGSTGDDYAWLCAAIQEDGFDIYVADFEHLGVYACRILVPGMSEIYPVDDLEWENNSNGAALRPAILHLAELDDEQCAQVLDTLNAMNIADERPVAALIGLAPDPDSLWADLRVGELKTLLALAIGDEEAVLEGCEWIRQFEQLDEARRRVYRCIATLLELEDPDSCETALVSLYGDETLDLAADLIDGELRFFGLPSPGLELAGCTLHQSLLAQYVKVHPQLA
ncbi:30S ribosomal protein S12 methylthiotransferase accessory factor YcaO [Azovibrio restrictus]|uniref:30S ribosomal protein S12 methylthiotransferase accessory factor YcaO n=1 Tax=Azovibrio restrictus TaxID=146938 RepID=UPI0026F2BE22|nr:30S ribosomal protein S12 methylthiotransferase accessory factor YcaO [Azovibrio restrictus]MDD3482425.1 30S ribosomal protein S12 methylthiotransferase accessory factor YcaO [Azovibrio restrictus]